ncbi:hypothetical protein SAMN05428975_4309 [Mucilaginibacter sp. OK268]|nr:hypothetical protein SAMN05428975_4309 [Mucilaginibacter sp. OK268]
MILVTLYRKEGKRIQIYFDRFNPATYSNSNTGNSGEIKKNQ